MRAMEARHRTNVLQKSTRLCCLNLNECALLIASVIGLEFFGGMLSLEESWCDWLGSRSPRGIYDPAMLQSAFCNCVLVLHSSCSSNLNALPREIKFKTVFSSP